MSDLRVFIPVEGEPFLHSSLGDRSEVRIPIRIQLRGFEETSFAETYPEQPVKVFRRTQVAHGVTRRTPIYVEELIP